MKLKKCKKILTRYLTLPLRWFTIPLGLLFRVFYHKAKLQQLFESGWWFAWRDVVWLNIMILLWLTITISIFTVF